MTNGIERAIGLVAAIVTIGGFMYSLDIQNYISTPIPNFSEYPFFLRTSLWIVIEGLFAIGFSMALIYISSYMIDRFNENNMLFLIFVPLFLLAVFVSAWQTIVFVRHFYDTSALSGETWFFGALIRNIIAFLYSIGVLIFHSEMVSRVRNEGSTEVKEEFKSYFPVIMYGIFYWMVAVIP